MYFDPAVVLRLEAFSVDNARTRLVVFLLGDPHSLEGGEGSEDGATDPDRVLTLRRSDDLDLHGGRSKGGEFLGHTVSDTSEHGCTTGEDGVSVEVFTDIDVALHDRVVSGFVDTLCFHTEEGRLEKGFRATEALVTDGDDLTVREFVVLFEGRRGSSGGHFSFKVESDVRELFLDVTDDFALGGGGERVTTFGEDLHHVVSKVTSGKVETEDSVRERVTFVDRDSVGNTVTRVEDDTGGTTGSVEGEYSLDSDVHGRGVEGFEHDLGHLLTVSLRVERGFGEENRVFFRGNAEFVVESVVPDLFHIVPVGNDTVFDRVLEGEDTTLGLSLVTDVRVLLAHTDHNTLVARATNDGREDGARSVITGETGFAHTGPVVNNECCYFIVTHFVWVVWLVF